MKALRFGRSANTAIWMLLIGALVCNSIKSSPIQLLDNYLKDQHVDVSSDPAKALEDLHGMLSSQGDHFEPVRSIVATLRSCSITPQCDRIDEIAGMAQNSHGERRVDKLVSHVAKRIAEHCGALVEQEVNKSLEGLQQLDIGHLDRLRKEDVLANSISAWYMGPYLDISLDNWVKFVKIILKDQPVKHYTSELIKQEMSKTCERLHQLTSGPVRRLFTTRTFALGKPEGLGMDWPKVFDDMPNPLQDIIYRSYFCQTAISNSEIVLKKISDCMNNPQSSNESESHSPSVPDLGIKFSI